MAVAGAGEGAQGHAMETVGEGDDAVAPGHLAGQLQRGLDGVGAGRAGELKAIVEAARLQDDILESRDEGGQTARASRRGRACQDEEIAVVGVYLNKKKIK